jgi:hypothetical protein
MRILSGKNKLIFSVITEEAEEFNKLNGKKGLVEISDKNLWILWRDLCDIIEEKCLTMKSNNQS